MIRRNWQSMLKHAQRMPRHLLFIMVAVGLVLVLTAFGLISQLSIQVTVLLNGEEQEITTQAKTVEELLQELEITYSAYDYIQPELTVPLEAGMQVEWRAAVPVQLSLYGQEAKEVWTAATTIEEFISEQELELKEGDVILPSTHVELEAEMMIEVVNFTEKVISEEEVIPFQVIRKQNDSLDQGEQQVVTQGKEGKAVHQIKLTYKNGQEIQRELVGTEVIEEKRDEIVAVGTKVVVSRGSLTFSPRQVLENVTLTSYSAGVEHTGKTPDHPQYAMTSSGVRATNAQTIAVDPKLIPLGTWVYIDGIGLRRAEDTGGAVKGKKIDLYFENSQDARAFGTKKGYKVYVIGKQKPS